LRCQPSRATMSVQSTPTRANGAAGRD
jgi:hypothetical protein